MAERLGWLADLNGSSLCRGLAERCLGLVAAEPDAEQHFRAALDALDGTGAEIERGRAHLVYAEWLRRTRRRREARAHLHDALAAFERSGAHVFSGRAKAELEAIGERPAADGALDALDLTPRELAIATMAAGGHTNAEIGAALFISPNTVDYHLRKVFQKLAVSSRRQLAERLSVTRH